MLNVLSLWVLCSSVTSSQRNINGKILIIIIQGQSDLYFFLLLLKKHIAISIDVLLRA